MPLKSDFWDFISWENEASGEESISSDPVMLNYQNELRKMPQERQSHSFYMQRNRENDMINSEREKKSKELQVENSRENLSPKSANARYRASRNDSVTKKSKALQSDTIASSPRVQSAQTSTDERSSNVCSTENGEDYEKSFFFFLHQLYCQTKVGRARYSSRCLRKSFNIFVFIFF